MMSNYDSREARLKPHGLAYTLLKILVSGLREDRLSAWRDNEEETNGLDTAFSVISTAVTWL